jgi:hypothetical protein
VVGKCSRLESSLLLGKHRIIERLPGTRLLAGWTLSELVGIVSTLTASVEELTTTC